MNPACPSLPLTSLSLALLLLAGLTTPAAAETRRLPALRSPANGAELWNNAPTLAWEPCQAKQIEIWLDGHRAETLPGNSSVYVPYPLSFGNHRWHLVVHHEDASQTTPEQTFSIADRPEQRLPEGSLLLRDGWKIRSSLEAGGDGRLWSTRPPVDGEPGWASSTVPVTALGALVRNGVYPNPYYGLNNMRIPDASDVFNQKQDLAKFSHIPGRNPWSAPYWFLNRFSCPAPASGKHVWLHLEEQNYRSEIWLNGHLVAGPLEVVGSDRRFRFDITSFLSKEGPNHLAIAVHPLDVAGEPAPEEIVPLADPGRNMGEDGFICLNYTRWSSLGWDWLPPIRDRNLGLTGDVYLTTTEAVEFKDPEVAAVLQLTPNPVAEVQARVELVNQGATPFKGRLDGRLVAPDGTATLFNLSCTLAPGSQTLLLSSEKIPQLRLKQPALWWPNGEGEPLLHRLELALASENGTRVASWDSTFGIRKIDTFLRNGSRVFVINGREVFLQGGNWVNDMTGSWTASRFEREMQLTRHSRLNFLRVWGPDGVPPAAFFDAADKNGILIWQDFLHDHWGTFNNRLGYEPYLNLFLDVSSDVIRRLRNHPSLFLWCGGNEGPSPRETWLRDKLLPTLDLDHRYYLTASLADGIHGGGPYHMLEPEAYFRHRRLTGFNGEIGPSGVPEWESLQKFLPLPPASWAPGRFPLSAEWSYHDATDQKGDDERKFSTYDRILRSRFGSPEGTDLKAFRDYSRRTQLVNADAYRSAVEALNRQMGSTCTGFAFWKFNGAWPSMTWQLVDWYLQPNAGFYEVRRALEPLHAQWDRDTRHLTLVNRTPNVAKDLVLHADLVTLEGKPLWSHQQPVSLEPHRPLTLDAQVPEADSVSLLVLHLVDANGKVLARSSYWQQRHDDHSALWNIPAPSVAVETRRLPGKPVVEVRLTNSGPEVLLLARLRLKDAATGLEVTPTLWSDNYVSLLPGETVELTAETPAADFPPQVILTLEPINGAEQPLPLKP